MHPYNRVFDPSNPYGFQENNPSPPPTRPIARPFSQSPIDLSPTSIDLSQNESVPETQPPKEGPSASKPIKKVIRKKPRIK
ncbi:hypothetical protein HanXRQr2_Chr17g0799621 [Helianthus annuus]|uniref:Uncharacterized protein n=1 Tax=Helianthus annuus TaxID=4232 RepID=A0A251RPA3_HELAN|nr:hypothetical protein HanXRQr2_Chr17g0799621 [Helianthus annuus]KAJ0812900.1 hypothetical protein HanPSC8_Chr17g0767211 [Helianthus annuus]